ncbi:CD302 antigen-like isoform X1 [Hippocampus comes]|uniref:CD302 antigen-like isoform X1 n=1 Tax=Hippocampus comes TaxID=109280 RepID=UPI00094EA28B|nr:PREDICTED: CD302 antigen-like isoform X1 [Hippocampus comes]
MELPQKNGRRAASLTCCLCVLLLQLQAAWTSADCPSDGRTWVPFKDRCYHFVHGEEDKLKVYNFESAKSLCPHSELLSIQSAEENDFVVKYSPEVWKGEVNVWLGMYYDTNSEGMMWFDEEPVKFTNWEPGSSPSDFVPMETCVAVHSDTGKWERVSCLDDLENGVVCETAQKADQAKKKSSGLLSGLVILCIIAIVAVSVVLWFLHQRQHPGSSVVTGFEYHPPFRAPDGDRSCLVEAEELDGGP